MKAEGARKAAGEPTRAQINEALHHPLRERILRVLSEGTASCTQLAEQLGESFDQVYYHLRKLRDLNCVELVRVDRARGGRESFYRATVRYMLDSSDVEALSRLTNESHSVSIIEKVFAEIRYSMEDGAFDSSEDRAVLRTHHLLDKEAFHKIVKVAERTVKEFLQIEAESVERRSRSGENGFMVTTAILSFINAPE